MKLIYIIGMPGCGKSTLMKHFMRSREWVRHRPIDLLDTHVSGKIRVLGIYEEGKTFSGTDALSMAVSPKAVEYFQSNPDEIIIGEGDRLNNAKVFTSGSANAGTRNAGAINLQNLFVVWKQSVVTLLRNLVINKPSLGSKKVLSGHFSMKLQRTLNGFLIILTA